MFVTTPEFLPQHREHRQQVPQIISAAETRGRSRMAEMNHQVLNNLDTIITALETETPILALTLTSADERQPMRADKLAQPPTPAAWP
jgi:hypothetical protein